MNVQIASPKEEVIFEGEFDAVVATENGAEFQLVCDNCSTEDEGTCFDLIERGWTWELSIDNQTLEIVDSHAECSDCTNRETLGEKAVEKPVYRKAAEHPDQKTLKEAIQ